MTKTVIFAGYDNSVFSYAEFLNPAGRKLVGIATPIEQAWNIYDENGKLKESIEEIPVMPIDAVAQYEADILVLAASTIEEEEKLKYDAYRVGFEGEVLSVADWNRTISHKTAMIRRLIDRLEELQVEGAAADLGAGYGDISWQLNALMPERTLYLFDTFTGNDARDVAVEREKELSDPPVGLSVAQRLGSDSPEKRILTRLPYPENVVVKKGWFPETAYDLEDETYAFVHMDTGLYNPTYAGLQYFFPRLSRGGFIILSGYENGKNRSVRQAVQDLEEKYGAFLIVPVNDLEGSVVIIRP